jgi:hypothetical protein
LADDFIDEASVAMNLMLLAPASRKVRPATVTLPPAAAAACASARPTPPVPPTTRTCLPASAADSDVAAVKLIALFALPYMLLLGGVHCAVACSRDDGGSCRELWRNGGTAELKFRSTF